jgi:hypothetical protein
MPFTRFATQHTTGPWGDVARDLRDDPQVKRTWSFKRLSKHLMDNHRPVERVWVILEEMNEAYKRQEMEEFQGFVYPEEDCEFCGEEDVDGHECIPERREMDR